MKLAEDNGVLLTPLKWRFHCKGNAEGWPSSGDLFMQGSTDQTLWWEGRDKGQQWGSTGESTRLQERLPVPSSMPGLCFHSRLWSCRLLRSYGWSLDSSGTIFLLERSKFKFFKSIMYFSTMAQQGIDLKLDKWEALFYAKMQRALLCTRRKHGLSL